MKSILALPNTPGGALVRFLPYGSITAVRKTTVRIEQEPAWGMDVSSDEQWLLFAKFGQQESGLALIENFR